MESGIHLLLILITAWACGHLAEGVKLPAALGHVVAGILVALLATALTPLLPQAAALATSPAVMGVGEAGIFFLLLYAGIEMQPREIAAQGRQALVVGIGGVIVPLASGFLFAWWMLPESDLRGLQAFVVGVALSISAIAVAAKVFVDFNLLHRPIGRIAIAAAVIDDIIGLVLLGLVTSLIKTGLLPSLPEFALMMAQVALFFGVTWLLGHVASRAFWRLIGRIRLPGSHLMALLCIALAYGLFAELLGLHFILGPFMAGLYFESDRVGEDAYDRVDHTVNAVTSLVLGPVFFASIGLTIDLSALLAVPGFLGGLVLVAMLGKLIGCGLPAYWCNGHDFRAAAAIGIGMSGRGAVELFIVSIAYQAGVFATTQASESEGVVANLYSALVLTAILTTALTPLLLQWVLRVRWNGNE